LPACTASPLLWEYISPDFGDSGYPYLGLATLLNEEHDYDAWVEGRVPLELRGVF
jgi:hypothetical protein